MTTSVPSAPSAGAGPRVEARAAPESALVVVLGVLLLGFVVVVGREVGATVGLLDGGRGDAYQLFAVSLTGLMGAVFAVALGVTRPARSTPADGLRERAGRVYVLAYALAGGVALLVCLVRLGSSTVLLRSLAAAFLGTSVAAASAFFGAAPSEVRGKAAAP